jgi:D-alanyl-D-alanine-carboxypeptidase/D-alanyl-D-alanine-endopeptidase
VILQRRYTSMMFAGWLGLVVFVTLLFPIGAYAQQHFPSNDDLRVMLCYLVEDRETTGIVLGILEADGSTRVVSCGSGGPNAQPLGPKSVFEMGSITKVFTGTLLADMVDRGEVKLTDPVSKYLPANVKMPSRNGREITLLDLATHRSALPRMPANMQTTPSNPYPDYSIEDLYAFLSQHELRRDIESEYEYSNIGVALLGHVLSLAAGKEYEQLLRERILDPLGMRMSSTLLGAELQRWLVQGHDGTGKPAPARTWPHLPGMGGLRSNAEEMLLFLKANVVEPTSRLHRVIRAAHDVKSSIDPNAKIGLNWVIRSVGGRRFITHSGATQGFNTEIAFDPDKKVGYVLLTNTSAFGDDIGLDFLRRGPPLAIPVVDVDRNVLARYAGMYETGVDRHMVVRLENDGTLTLQAPNNVRFRLYAESDTKFFVKRTPWRFTFNTNEAGEVVSMAADLEGSQRVARRVGGAPPRPAVVAGNDALDLPISPEDMARYEATYVMQRGPAELRVFIQDGRLMAQPTGQNPTRLLHQGNQVFVPAAAMNARVTFKVENGRATAITLLQGGNVYPGTRKP